MPKCEDDLKAAKAELKAARELEKDLRKEIQQKTTHFRPAAKGRKVVR